MGNEISVNKTPVTEEEQLICSICYLVEKGYNKALIRTLDILGDSYDINKPFNNHNPLMEAIMNNNLDTINILCKNYSADVNSDICPSMIGGILSENPRL